MQDFIGWFSGKHPDRRTIFASFSDGLGEIANRDLYRSIKDGAAYGRIFPDLRIDVPGWTCNNNHIEFVQKGGSFRLAPAAAMLLAACSQSPPNYQPPITGWSARWGDNVTIPSFTFPTDFAFPSPFRVSRFRPISPFAFRCEESADRLPAFVFCCNFFSRARARARSSFFWEAPLGFDLATPPPSPHPCDGHFPLGLGPSRPRLALPSKHQVRATPGLDCPAPSPEVGMPAGAMM